MKVIFLDFDGVITTQESKWKIDYSRLDKINEICKKCNANIVVSSSWRIGYRGDITKFCKEFPEDFRVKANSPVLVGILNEFISYLYGMTDSKGLCRGEEIKRWLDEHDEVENYIILDDDSDMLDEQLLHFVQTDTYEGITDREMKLCVSVLNNEEIYSMIRLNNVLKYRWKLKCEHPEIENNIKEILK